MITHAATRFEADTAHLLWLEEKLVQKLSEMMGEKGLAIKGLVRASEDVHKQLVLIVGIGKDMVPLLGDRQ